MTVVWHHEHGIHERHVTEGRGKIVSWIAVALVVIAVIAGGAWFALKGWSSGKVPVFAERILWIPIGSADHHLLWYPDIARLAHGIAAADARSTVTETDYAQAVDAAVRRNALNDIAQELQVSVTDAQVKDAVTWTDDIRSFEALAGWRDDEYLANIERQFVLANVVNDAVLKSESQQAIAQNAMKDIQKKLAEGIAFQDVAREFSEDPATAQASGSFGYVLPSEVDEIFAPVFALPVGTISDVITTDDAYWIVRREENFVEDSGIVRALLRGIAVKKETLAKVLDARASAITPTLWVK